MFDIGLPELVMILVIALLVFGPSRMAEIGRDLGKTIRDFRRATSDVQKEFSDALKLDDEKKPAPAWQPSQPPAPVAAPMAVDMTSDVPAGRPLTEIAAGVAGGAIAGLAADAETPAPVLEVPAEAVASEVAPAAVEAAVAVEASFANEASTAEEAPSAKEAPSAESQTAIAGDAGAGLSTEAHGEGPEADPSAVAAIEDVPSMPS